MAAEIWCDEGLYFLGSREITDIELEEIHSESDGFDFAISEKKETLAFLQDGIADDLDEGGEEDPSGLKPLNRVGFYAIKAKTKTILYFGSARTIFDLECALEESAERRAAFRAVLEKIGLLAFVQSWDSMLFSTGRSFMEWFSNRFPESPTVATPLTASSLPVTDLLSEFFEDQSEDMDSSYALKAAIGRLGRDDQALLLSILDGSTQLSAAKIEEESLRFLKLLKGSI